MLLLLLVVVGVVVVLVVAGERINFPPLLSGNNKGAEAKATGLEIYSASCSKPVQNRSKEVVSVSNEGFSLEGLLAKNTVADCTITVSGSLTYGFLFTLFVYQQKELTTLLLLLDSSKDQVRPVSN